MPEPITTIVSAIAGAVLSNIQKIYAVIKDISGVERNLYVNGKWTGSFKEYVQKDGKEMMTHESIKIKGGKNFKGTLVIGPPTPRSRKFTGKCQDNLLAFTYVAHDEKNRVGIASMVLKRYPGRVWKGYWLGLDSELDMLVCGPYILVDEGDKAAFEEHKKWLEQPIYPYNLLPPLILKSLDLKYPS